MNSIMTLAYYNDPQNRYAENTLKADMSDGYSHFLKYLPASGKIMDFGCGSGRDSLYFINNGFQVTPIDGSEKMCNETTRVIGYKARHMTFQQLDYMEQFDGVWACASLLHVSEKELPGILQRIANSLKSNGVLYASWKYGDSERIDNASKRFFCDMNEERVTAILNDVGLFDLMEMWLSVDIRAEYKSQKWINIIARKREKITLREYDGMKCSGSSHCSGYKEADLNVKNCPELEPEQENKKEHIIKAVQKNSML